MESTAFDLDVNQRNEWTQFYFASFSDIEKSSQSDSPCQFAESHIVFTG